MGFLKDPLSHVLFNLYIEPLGEIIEVCGLQHHQYADDTQLYVYLSGNVEELKAGLEYRLSKVDTWFNLNWLKLNPSEVLLL